MASGEGSLTSVCACVVGWGLSLKAACSHKLEVVQGLASPTPSPISDCPRLPAQLEFLHLKSEVGPPDL